MTPFRLDIAVPATNIKSAFAQSFKANDGVVQQVEVALKKEKGRISTLTADLFDPGLKILDSLPDPAFFDIPVKLYAGTPGSQSLTTLVFEGNLVALPGAVGNLSHIQIVAADYSHKARVRALAKTYKNSSSLDIAKKIAAVYGWTVDASTGDANLVQRTVSIGIPGAGDTAYSDFDILVRELESDGLTAHMHGKTLYIRQLPAAVYGHTFRRGDGIFKLLEFRIQHVKGAGGLGNINNPVAFDHKGTEKALKGTALAEGNKVQGGDARTHRRPVGGPSSNSDAHSQDTAGAKWSNKVTRMRGRKDEATLHLNPVPDLYLHHRVNLDGFCSKLDGEWEALEIRHLFVSGSGSATEVHMARGVSKHAAKQANVAPFAYSNA